MATLEDGINFTGSIGKMSAYRMRGSDKIILRAKGGPTKKQVRHSPLFERTRLNNKEFSGAIQAVRGIRRALAPVQHLADYNFTPQLTSLCRNIQQQDPVNHLGERSVHLSQHRDLLLGFRLNKRNPLGNIISNPLSGSVDRQTKSALVQLPRLIRGINLVLPWKHPLYRFSMVLGTAADIIYDGTFYTKHDFLSCPLTLLNTQWYVTGAPFLPQSFALQLDTPEALQDTQTLILAVGIEMGMPTSDGVINRVRYAGAASIITVG